MTYTARDTYGIYKENGHKSPSPQLMGANTLIGDHVHNVQNVHLGDVKEIVLDMRTGKVAYAVLSFGGVFSLGEKLFAVPWNVLKLDAAKKRFVLDVDKSRFENAPGFDSNNDWPDMADQAWIDGIQTYYSSSAH